MCYRLPDRFKNFFLSKERAVFRYDPVPGTGVKNWRFGHFYKTACCTQERKLYGDPDHRQYSRGKRYPCNLPNAWDDYPKSRSHNKRDWKRVKKKKQWMKKGDNIMFPTFTPLGAIDSVAEVVEGDSSQKKKLNYDMSETKVNSSDYTRPGKGASQTDDDDLRPDPVEEGYEVTEDQKNPERNYGAPGIRKRIDATGNELEGIELKEIDVPEDNTPVVVDDSKKHGTKLKYRIGGDEGKTGPE